MSNVTPGAAARRESARGHGTKPGEFGFQAHSAPDESAFDAGPNWGEVTIAEGDRSPWGEVDHVKHYDSGIAQVSTASHGGIKLSAERNRAMPAEYRQKGGWYEEDCDHNLVRATFPESFASEQRSADEVSEQAEESIRQWYPNQWEAVTGETLQPGQSHVRDATTRRAANVDNFVTHGAWTADDDMVRVIAKRASTGEERHFLIPKAEYDTREGMYYAITDPDAFEEHSVTEVPPSVAPPASAGTFDTSGLTPAVKQRAERELSKLVRDHDGTVSTYEEYLHRSEISGKTLILDEHGKTKYYLSLPDSRVAPVSKAIWDASQAPSDVTPSRAASHNMQRASIALEKARDAYSNSSHWGDPELYRKRAEAQERYDTARGAYEVAAAASTQERIDQEWAATAGVTRANYAETLAAALGTLTREPDGRVSADNNPADLQRFRLLTEHGAANGYLRTPPTTEGQPS